MPVPAIHDILRRQGAVRNRLLLSAAVLVIGLTPRAAAAQNQIPAAASGVVSTAAPGGAPDPRVQYPPFLANSYVGVRVGFLDTPFSTRQLEPGTGSATIRVQHPAFGVALFGHNFGPYFSAEVAYVRPARFASFEHIGSSGATQTVWMAFGQFAGKVHLPITRRISVHGDAGLGVSSRRGFQIDGVTIVKDAHFRSVLLGAGLDIHVTPHWDTLVDLSYIPASSNNNQPRALYVATGLRYTMHALPAQRVAEIQRSAPLFPEHMLGVSYTTRRFGYEPNHFISHTVPIFWGGRVHIGSGLTVRYDRNVFHTPRRFAVDFGVNVAGWQSDLNRERFFSISAAPRLRFIVVRQRLTDIYVWYSTAGATFISRPTFDGSEIGTNHFTFQDGIGVGAFLGRARHVTIGVSLSHFSNGNLETRNPGVAVPVTFDLGYAF
jgi:hypothetical protein